MRRINPTPWQIGKNGEVLGPGQHRGLEAAHRARRRSAARHCALTDQVAQQAGEAVQAVGAVDVFVACEALYQRREELTLRELPTRLAK